MYLLILAGGSGEFLSAAAQLPPVDTSDPTMSQVVKSERSRALSSTRSLPSALKSVAGVNVTRSHENVPELNPTKQDLVSY